MQIGEPGATPYVITEDVAGVPQAVAPGIWRIPLPLPFTLRWVNAYVLIGDDERVLVDCGLGTHKTLDVLTAGLAALDLTFADLTTLLITHAHPDHIGLAAEIAAAMPHPRVVLLDLEARTMTNVWGARAPEDLAPLRELHLRAGLAEPLVDEGVLELLGLSSIVHLPPTAAITTVSDNQTLILAGRSWRVLWTPGHAQGHLCLLSDDVIIVGDHILPRISPNVSLYPDALSDPIQSHLDALAHVAALTRPGLLALPGHGQPFTALPARAEELIAGHLKRADAMLEALQAAPAPMSAAEVANIIFARRLRENVDHRLAIGETLAHLERHRIAGRLRRDDSEHIIRYAPVSR